MTSSTILRAFPVLATVFLAISLHAQSELHCLSGGQYLPVADFEGGSPLCFTGDDLVRGKLKDITLLPAASFSRGFIEIDVSRNKRDGVVRQDGMLTFTSPRDWYTLICKVTADRDMEDCYYAISFDTYGKKSYYVRGLGRLEAGKPKTVRVYMKLGYEMPDQLHLFSGMEEVRTTLVPEAYSYSHGKFLLASR